MGLRLSGMMGISPAQYLRRTERVNVLRQWPGKNGKGDAFPLREARESAYNLAQSFEGHRVLLLGNNVARSFDLRMDYLTWRKVKGFVVAVVPHPSGINRWWNLPKNRRKARRFLRTVLA